MGRREKDIFVLCLESKEVNWVVPKAVARKGREDRFGSRCRGHTRRKSELQTVSAARMRPGRGCWPCTLSHLTAQARSRRGSQQARPGQVPVSTGG